MMKKIICLSFILLFLCSCSSEKVNDVSETSNIDEKQSSQIIDEPNLLLMDNGGFILNLDKVYIENEYIFLECTYENNYDDDLAILDGNGSVNGIVKTFDLVEIDYKGGNRHGDVTFEKGTKGTAYIRVTVDYEAKEEVTSIELKLGIGKENGNPIYCETYKYVNSNSVDLSSYKTIELDCGTVYYKSILSNGEDAFDVDNYTCEFYIKCNEEQEKYQLNIYTDTKVIDTIIVNLSKDYYSHFTVNVPKNDVDEKGLQIGPGYNLGEKHELEIE